MPKAEALKPSERSARLYADRLILEQLTDMFEVMKPSEISDRLKDSGLGLPAVRSLLASNPKMFAYQERRWVPAARVESTGKPFHEAVRMIVERYGAPMPFDLCVNEVSRTRGRSATWVQSAIIRAATIDDTFFLTKSGELAPASIVFKACDESIERALAFNGVDEADVEKVEEALGRFNWNQQDAIMLALEKCAPVKVKALGAAAWKKLSPTDPKAPRLYDWRTFNAELLSIPGFVYAPNGKIYHETEVSKWIKIASQIAPKIKATIEIEDVAPLELKAADVKNLIKEIKNSEESITVTDLLERFYEITPVVKTFPDDMGNMLAALQSRDEVWWVGGDRFRAPESAPEYIRTLPKPFKFETTIHMDAEGEMVDVEMNDEGLSSSLRKLLSHPLATDVKDEDVLPEPKTIPTSLRLVLKSIHRELGTFPMCQFPTGFFDAKPQIQELIFIDPNGRELQVWLNHRHRLLFGLLDWWLDQPVESGAVFKLTKTDRPNVFDFQWLEQTDPVVYISNTRMEELREIASRTASMSTFDVLREVMVHWPKGADFLTVLWEINVVRRTSRRLLASILSGYACFYQRSGSPVWHYDHKKVEQGFDKTKRKFVIKD